MASHAEKNEGNFKYILISVIIIGILTVGIYFIVNRENNTELTSTKNTMISLKEKTIEDFKSKLEENGLVITNAVEKSSSMIGAKEGVGYEINGSAIEVYIFDEKSKEELTKNNIKSAKTDGIISMPSFNNMTFKVKYNDGLCLVNYENHPDKEKILKIFNNL